jgi:vancomycin resistance protein YoaR
VWVADDVLLGRDRTARGLELEVPAALEIEPSVGRLSVDQLRNRLDEVARSYAAATVSITVQDEELEIGFPAAGVFFDVDRTLADAANVNRGGPLAWTSRLFTNTSVPLRFRFNEEVAAETLRDATPEANAPIEPLVLFEDGEFVLKPGVPGYRFDVSGALESLVVDLGERSPDASIATVAIEPETSDEKMQQFVNETNQLTSRDLVLSIGGEAETIDSAVVRSWLEVEASAEGPSLSFNEAAVSEVVRERFAEVGTGGIDATFDVIDDKPMIIESTTGTACCAADSAERIRDAVLAGQRRVTLDFESVGRENNTQWAQDLRIVELIGEFKTRYVDGQSRVTNIKRISELTRGVIILPGETWSVNDYVGRRTEERGFVSAGAIENGVLVADVGGGISQYATTMLNAAFFAGLEVPDYRAHSIYFSRYPYGREATLAYGAIDLKITNITDNAILVWPTTDSTGITVQLFGTTFVTGQQTGQSSSQVGTSCTKVITERTRTFVDGREPVIDYFSALYRPQGLLCNGESSV